MSGTGTTARSGTLDAVVWVSGALAIGSALLAVAHLGLQIPILSALGPGGTRAVIPAVIAFGVSAPLHALVALGVARRRYWAWSLGIVIGALTLLGAAMPFRGVVSAIGIVLAGLQLALLLSPDGRRLRR